MRALALVFLSACASFEVEGVVDGAPLEAKDVVATIVADAGKSTLQIVFADFAPLCETVSRQAIRPDSSALVISIDFPVARPVPGVFAVSSGTRARLSRWDAGCVDRLADRGAAQSGAVAVETVSATQATGTFDLVFLGGGLKGSFSAEVCRVDLTDESDKNACKR